MKKILSLLLIPAITICLALPASADSNAADAIHVDSTQMDDGIVTDCNFYDYDQVNSLSLDDAETVIVIDAGHGGYDIGSSHIDGSYESDKVLTIALYIKEELETYTDTKVILTRSTDVYVPLTERTAIAARAGADVFVSLHTDFDSSYSAEGASVFYPNTNYRPDLSAFGKTLSQNILKELNNIGVGTFQGCVSHTLSYYDAYSDPGNYLYADGSLGDYYSVIRTSKQAGLCGILVEHGFGSSYYDFNNFFSTDSQLKKLAIADATGIAKTFSLSKEPALPKEFVRKEDNWFYMAGDKLINTTDIIYGCVNETNGWWFVKDGQVQLSYTGVEHNSNGWWYVENGKVDFDFNGFASNSNGDWYLENGKVGFNKNDIIHGTIGGETGWWLVENSKVVYGRSVVAHNANGWWYVGPDGKVDFNCNSVEENTNGWWYVRNGKVDFDYTGIAENRYGWWRIENGKVNFNCNSVERNEYGWWYLKGGRVDFTYTGIANNAMGWWRIEGGKVNFDATGIFQNENGWWYLENGKVDFNFTGTYPYEGKDIRITNGQADMR